MTSSCSPVQGTSRPTDLVTCAADLELLGRLTVVDRLHDGLGAVRARRTNDVLAGRWQLRRVAERTCTESAMCKCAQASDGSWYEHVRAYTGSTCACTRTYVQVE